MFFDTESKRNPKFDTCKSEHFFLPFMIFNRASDELYYSYLNYYIVRDFYLPSADPLIIITPYVVLRSTTFILPSSILFLSLSFRRMEIHKNTWIHVTLLNVNTPDDPSPTSLSQSLRQVDHNTSRNKKDFWLSKVLCKGKIIV